MNSTLYRRRMRDVHEFRQDNGPITAWPADRFEVYLDLIRIAQAARWHRLRTTERRVKVLAAVAYIAPLYALAELAGAVRGGTWWQLEAHLDRADSRFAFALVERDQAGDHDFTDMVTRATNRITSTVGRLTARIAQV
ncbi:hypothetical protein ACH4CE_35320 [Streptomyces gelaticus]|uniref:hypothetical protein n=1 Tax=Streptomyces gelaticus TaxID=285446 RepID=UPI0037997D62